jgi:SSS family solute:Na+ symporter
MIPPFNALEFGIVVAMFAVVTVLGFMATRWKRATSLASIEEWGLGGRRFGTWVTWFLLGGDWPLWIAFIALAAYTWTSGLRAPALIAFVKDTLIYVVILVAAIYIPYKLGGYDVIFHRTDTALAAKGMSTLLTESQYLGYSTLALGSALALFLYPHAVTGVLASRSRKTVKKNMSLLPAYSLMLGFIALLGYMAIAAHVKPVGGTAKAPDTTTIVPVLFNDQFPQWFAGIAFGAIVIGALVPAAIMGISAANTFARDIYRPYFRRTASDREQGLVSQIVSVVLKLGAVAVIVSLKPSFAIELQLIGGVIVIQILPAVVLGLYTRWYHRWALVAGWVAGMGLSIYMLWVTPSKTAAHFGSASFAFKTWGFDTKMTIWTGIVGLIANLIVATALTLVFGRLPRGRDETSSGDYEVEAEQPVPVGPGPTPGPA